MVLLMSILLLLAGCGGDSSPNLLSGTVDDQQGGGTDNVDWRLVWSDEFDGSSLDTSNWSHDLGDGSSEGIPGWGNNELQYYREENTTVSGGFLTIEAREEAFAGKDYTSSRIKTQAKQSFQFGKIEIRAKLPEGQGLWPALWMLGESITTVGWPASGEIDIMEMIGGSDRENTVHGTIHWDAAGHLFSGGSTTLSSGTFADDFHLFTIIWDSVSIKWFVDDQLYHSESIVSTSQSELKAQFFLLFNVAVGGDWPGSPDESTSFPQQMVVDYVRVYQGA